MTKLRRWGKDNKWFKNEPPLEINVQPQGHPGKTTETVYPVFDYKAAFKEHVKGLQHHFDNFIAQAAPESKITSVAILDSADLPFKDHPLMRRRYRYYVVKRLVDFEARGMLFIPQTADIQGWILVYYKSFDKQPEKEMSV